MTVSQDYLDSVATFGNFESVVDVTTKDERTEGVVVLEAKTGGFWVRLPIKTALVQDGFPARALAELLVGHLRSHMEEAGISSDGVG